MLFLVISNFPISHYFSLLKFSTTVPHHSSHYSLLILEIFPSGSTFSPFQVHHLQETINLDSGLGSVSNQLWDLAVICPMGFSCAKWKTRFHHCLARFTYTKKDISKTLVTKNYLSILFFPFDPQNCFISWWYWEFYVLFMLE